jgi:hypothetical protein
MTAAPPVLSVQERTAEFLRIVLNHLGLTGQYSIGEPIRMIPFTMRTIPSWLEGRVIGVDVPIRGDEEDFRAAAIQMAAKVRSTVAGRLCCSIQLSLIAELIGVSLRDEVSGMSIICQVSHDEKILRFQVGIGV